MLDILRSLTRTAEEKRQEELNAYLDGELQGRAREQFEARLAVDPALRAELAQLRAVKQGVAQLPRLRAPRNYTLDPAAYGRPAAARGASLYPALRLATVLTAFLLVLAFGLEIVPGTQTAGDTAEQPVALVETATEEVAVEDAAETTLMEASAAPAPEEAEEPTARTAADEEVAVEGEADMAGEAEITANATLTEETTLMAAPELEMAQEEAAEEESFDATEMPAGEAGAPPAPEATVVAEDAVAVATPPLAPTPTPEPADVATREGVGLEPLRVVQALLGVAFVILLTATLLVRRQRV
jgi:hypothetical protein